MDNVWDEWRATAEDWHEMVSTWKVAPVQISWHETWNNQNMREQGSLLPSVYVFTEGFWEQ